MADSPLKRLAQLVGGVILTQGRLPHQVLGQLMIANSTSAEVAGANVVVAAASRHRNVLAQVALRTAAPALAVQSLVSRQEKRLRRLADQAHERERKAAAASDCLQAERTQCNQHWLELQRAQEKLEARSRAVDELMQELDARAAELDARAAELDARAAELEQQRHERATNAPSTVAPSGNRKPRKKRSPTRRRGRIADGEGEA